MSQEKIEFYNKIVKAVREFHKNDPCSRCGHGNGCDDCRGCNDGRISNNMWKEVQTLMNEYKEKFGGDYYKEAEESETKRREKVRKEVILKEVWETCSFDEIIEAGIKYSKK